MGYCHGQIIPRESVTASWLVKFPFASTEETLDLSIAILHLLSILCVIYSSVVPCRTVWKKSDTGHLNLGGELQTGFIGCWKMLSESNESERMPL